MALFIVQRLRGSSTRLSEISRALPGTALRCLRADATDPEARGDDGNSSEQSLAADAHQPSARSGHGQRTAAGEGVGSAPPCQHGPVRAAKRRKGERRKVLPVLGGDTFTSNVASMLVRWPHAPASRQPRNWMEVTSTERFRWLFPRRPTPLTEQAVNGLRALAASDSDDGAGNFGTTAAAGGAPYDAHQAALLELIERLQALRRHLQDSLPDDDDDDDDESGGDTIVALAAYTQDGGSGDVDGADEGPSASHSYSRTTDTAGSPCGGAAVGRSERGRDGSGPMATSGPLGRRRRRPAGWQRGRKPAPPWDDTQPFQTHVGTVFHFWRLCPYG